MTKSESNQNKTATRLVIKKKKKRREKIRSVIPTRPKKSNDIKGSKDKSTNTGSLVQKFHINTRK